MIGLTHAIGGASSILIANKIFPDFFQINLWLIILSFYAAQLPDIDIEKSTISKNIFIKPFRILLSPFIDGHRAKQTHSIFGTLFFMLLIMPTIGLFGIQGWILLGISYFSHVFLDYFNPTGVKLFYFPILNSEPRAWSLYNTPFLIMSEVPYLFKRIFSKKAKRSEIKFDGVGVMTGQGFEKVITYILWITFFILLGLNLTDLKNNILLDSNLFAILPILTLVAITSILFSEKKELKKIKKYTFLFLGIGLLLIFASKYGELDYLSKIKDLNLITTFVFLSIFSLIPLFIKMLGNVIINLFSFTKMIIPSKESTSYFNSAIEYTTLTNTILLLLLITSIFHIDTYKTSIEKLIDITSKESNEEIGTRLYKSIKEQYLKSYEDLKLEIKQNDTDK